ITSIPDAFSSWGGAFSVAWGLFYFIFGAGRLDPFGLFTACLLGRKARKYLIEGYKEHEGYGNMAPDTAPKESQILPTVPSIIPPACASQRSNVSGQPSSHSDEASCKSSHPPFSEKAAKDSGDLSLMLEKLMQDGLSEAHVDYLQSQGEHIRRQYEHIRKVEKDFSNQGEHIRRQDEHIRKVEKDFSNMRRLLSDYYLDMDLVSEAAPPIRGKSWYNRFWSHKAQDESVQSKDK
ncbi:hypothetical protein BGZ67_009656, partial [Mortierella alpina]